MWQRDMPRSIAVAGSPWSGGWSHVLCRAVAPGLPDGCLGSGGRGHHGVGIRSAPTPVHAIQVPGPQGTAVPISHVSPLVKLRAGREACSEVHRVRYRSARETTNQDRTVHMYSVCTRIPCRPRCIAGTDTEAGPCGLQRGPVRDQPARGEALRHADGAQAAAPEGCHR